MLIHIPGGVGMCQEVGKDKNFMGPTPQGALVKGGEYFGVHSRVSNTISITGVKRNYKSCGSGLRQAGENQSRSRFPLPVRSVA